MINKSKKRVPAEAKIIGSNLKYLREASGISQQQMGKILGVSFQQVQKYESGSNRFPVEKLHRLRHFYNVPYEIFFQGVSFESEDWVYAVHDGLLLFRRFATLKNQILKRKIQQILQILLE